MYYSNDCPEHGRNSLTRIFLTLFLLLLSTGIFSQNPAAPPPALYCDSVNYMTAPDCEYISNGHFDELIDIGIYNSGEISIANWWNSYLISGNWECITPNGNPGTSGIPADLFSNSQGFSGWTDLVNNYSSGNSINDPTNDGNYAAINLHNDNATSFDDRSYLEQELSNYLYPGFSYKLTYKTRFAPVSSHTSNIGIYLTENALLYYNFSLGNPTGTTVLHNTPIANSTNWNQVTIPFTISPIDSPLPLKHITIGHEEGALSTPENNNQYPVGSGQHKGFYYIDDIHLKLVNAPNQNVNMTFCGSNEIHNLSAIYPNTTGTWSVLSGPASLSNATYNDVDVYYPFLGSYVIQYSYDYNSNCDSLYTETFNVTIEENYELSNDTVLLCEPIVNLSEYTNGIVGVWTIVDGEGEIDYLPFGVVNYSGYGIGYSTLNFSPAGGQGPCTSGSYNLVVYYTPFPKTTTATYDEDIWNDAAIDSYGNIYVVGTFISRTEIDENMINIGIPLTNNKKQFMVAKYDSCGILLWWAWGKSTCPTMGWSTGTSIAIDEEYKRVYIAGEYAGMKYKNSNGNEYLIQGLGNCSDDSGWDRYVLEMSSDNGNYEKFLTHIGNIQKIKSMAVAKDGPNAHYLYLGGGDMLTNNFSSIIQIQTDAVYSSSNNLWQTLHDIISGSQFKNEITDIFYKDQHIYAVGTTEGPLVFGSLSVNINPNAQKSTAWVAKVKDGNQYLSAVAINHGGEGNYNQQREMFGSQIYVDLYDNVIVSGLVSDYLFYPFSSGVTYQFANNGMSPPAFNVYIAKLDQNLENYYGTPNFEIIESPNPSFELNKIAMTGFKDNIYISASYTGKELHFLNTNTYLDLTNYSPTPTDREKIMVAHYTTFQNLTKDWVNTTLTFDNLDRHYTKAMCALNNKIYTVGNFENFMNFEYDYNGIVDEISSTSNLTSAFIFRTDDMVGGMFKYNLNDAISLNKIEALSISIFPNPNNGSFQLDGVTETDTVEIVDILGKKINYTISHSKEKMYIQINNFVGVAIVKVNTRSYRVLIQ